MSTKPTKPATVTTTTADLKPDPSNRRQRTARGARMLVEALEHVGAARSIVIDEDNEILAGNGVVEAAAEIGITAMQIVESDGRSIIAVRRRGLTPEDKRALALYDNRTGELGEWVPEQLARDKAAGELLLPWWDEAEQRRLFKDQRGKEPAMKEIDTGPVADRFWIAVRGPLKLQAEALQRLRDMLKDHPDINIELGLMPQLDGWEP